MFTEDFLGDIDEEELLAAGATASGGSTNQQTGSSNNKADATSSNAKKIHESNGAIDCDEHLFEDDLSDGDGEGGALSEAIRTRVTVGE